MNNRITLLLLLMVVTIATYAGQSMKVVKFSINPYDWTHQPPDLSAMSFNYYDSTITKDVFDNGTVMVYLLGTSGGGWWPLPYTFPSEVGPLVSYNYLPGHIEIRFYGARHNLTYYYKMVIISEDK